MMRRRRVRPSTPLFIQLSLLKYKDFCQLNSTIFAYKSIYNLIPSPIVFKFRVYGPYNLRNHEPLNVPFARSNQSKRFISVRGAEQWNSLPPDIRNARTVLTLKKKVKQYLLNEYNVVDM